MWVSHRLAASRAWLAATQESLVESSPSGSHRLESESSPAQREGEIDYWISVDIEGGF